MRIRNRSVLTAVALAVTGLALAAGCAAAPTQVPANAADEPQQEQAQVQAEETAAAEGTVDGYSEFLLAEIAENNAKYAGKVVTLPDGTRVQRTPTDWGIYNGYLLHADERGCNACHENLADTLVNMTAGYYWQPERHMQVNNVQSDINVMECVSCHQDGEPVLREMVHGIHANTEATCLSCHNVEEDGSYPLWDYVKYEKFFGLTTLDASTGTFDSDQTTLTADEDLFVIDWNHYDSDWAQTAQVNGYTDGTHTQDEWDAYELIIDGDGVDEELHLSLADLKAMDISVTRTKTEMCTDNAATGTSIMNVEIEGFSIKKLLDKLGVKPDAGTYSAVMDEWYPYHIDYPIADLTDTSAMLVYKVNGQDLTDKTGWPLQFWVDGRSAECYVKRVYALHVGAAGGEVDSSMADTYMASTGSSLEHEGEQTVEMVKSPHCAVLNTEDGQIIDAGEYTIEGYAFTMGEHNEEGAYVHSEGHVCAIEVSLDLGATWTRFDAAGDDPDVWTYWRYTNTYEPGAYVFYVRAVTTEGYVTPIIDKILLNVQ